jgi:alanine-synthesizing transaminase
MSDFSFSKRTDWELSANRLADELELLRSKHVDLIDLTESNPTRCGFNYPSELLKSLAEPANLTYAPDSKGMLKARREIAANFGNRIDPESIVLTSSTSEAYAFLLRLLVNPGERVLIGRPSYPLFQYLIELSDAEYDFYPLIFDGRWRLDFEALEEIVDASTRVIILVNPNNPTGSYISADELIKLNAFCRQHGLAIISDEVFFDYRLEDNHPGISLIGNRDVLTFVLGGLSKSLALPQMKLSWILSSGPEAQVKEALSRLEIIADTFLSVNTPVQNALGPWFGLQKDIQGQVIERVRRNYCAVRDFARRETIECLPSEGGWYAVLRIPSIKNEEDWILELLQNKHVSVHPGYFFDFQEEGHIVLSLLSTEERMTMGLQKILEFLNGR